jgi:hypothetical protein
VHTGRDFRSSAQLLAEPDVFSLQDPALDATHMRFDAVIGCRRV